MIGIIIGCILIFYGIYTYYQNEAIRFVNKMGAGINIGNTLDSTGLKQYKENPSPSEYATSWGSPELDEASFAYIKELGFNTVRIPVTWEEHLDDEMNISKEWMEYVQNAVDMALEQELYVIINIHHDKWLDLQINKKDTIIKQYQYVWNQIAERFADYEEYLLFEGMNEPRERDTEIEWTAGDYLHQQMVNELNGVFVETVRKSGGNNKKRYLLIGSYGNDEAKEAIDAMIIPKDRRIIVSIHMYEPYSFCQKENGDKKWDGETESIEEIFSNLNNRFIDKYIPVIITEYGCKDKNNLQERVQWSKTYKQLSEEYKIPCYWWDAGDYRILAREKQECIFPEIVHILTE